MKVTSQTVALAWLFAMFAMDACADNLLIPPTNVTPVAVARLLDDDSPNPTVEVDAPDAPLELTLDASESRDPDGQIQTYRWLSASLASGFGQADEQDAGPAEPSVVADAGVFGRWMPEGAAEGWPEDVMRPVVELPGVGTYAFTLWVIDDRGRVSEPSTLSIEVVAR